MKRDRAAQTRVRTHKSIFFTSTFVVALCTALVTLSLVVSSMLSAEKFADGSTRSRGLEVSRLVAQQAGGAIKFGKSDVLADLLNDTAANPSLVSAHAIRNDGS